MAHADAMDQRERLSGHVSFPSSALQSINDRDAKYSSMVRGATTDVSSFYNIPSFYSHGCSESDLEASRNQRELQALTSRLLDSNRDIALRLARLEPPPSFGSIRAPSTYGDGRTSTMTSITHVKSFAFESDLQGSWVYRKALRPADDVSCRQSIAFSHAWSSFSEVSLSEISLISVVALPIASGDLANGHHYQHNETALSSQSVVSGAVTGTLPAPFESNSDIRRWPFGIREYQDNESPLTRGDKPDPSKGFESHESALEVSSEEEKPLIVSHGDVSFQVSGNEPPIIPAPISVDRSDTTSAPFNTEPHTDAISVDVVSELLDKLPMPDVLPLGESAEVFDAAGASKDASAQELAPASNSPKDVFEIPWPVHSESRKSRTPNADDGADTVQAHENSAGEKETKDVQDSLTPQMKTHRARRSVTTLCPQDALYDADSEKISRARSPRSMAAEKRRVRSPFPTKYTLVVVGGGGEGKSDITTQVSIPYLADDIVA